MGGRGSRFGKSNKGKSYGTEFSTVFKKGNIKFVKHNYGSATSPMETMAQGRTYVLINNQNKIKSITFYKRGKRYKQIDVTGKPHYIDGNPVLPHTHFGYNHSENGTYYPTEKENRIIAKVKKIWNNRN